MSQKSSFNTGLSGLGNTKPKQTGLGKTFKKIKDGQATAFMSIIEATLEAREGEIRNDGFHPSGCTACGRKLIYAMFDPAPVAPKFPPKTHFAFDVGTYLHMMIQDYAIESGLAKQDLETLENIELFRQVMKQVFKDSILMSDPKRYHELVQHFTRVINPNVEAVIKFPEYMVTGHADIVVWINGVKYVVDIKTMNSARFTYQSKPDSKEITQLMIYMHHEAAENGLIFQFNIDTKDYRGHHIKFADHVQMLERHIERFKFLKKCFENNEIPPHEREKDSTDCKKCDYFHKCWEGVVCEELIPNY